MRLLFVVSFMFSLNVLATEAPSFNAETLESDMRSIRNRAAVHLVDKESEAGAYIGWYRSRLPKLVQESFTNLQEQNKIKELTPEIRAQYKLDESYCHEKSQPDKHDHCMNVTAFYDKNTNEIYIDPSLDEKQRQESLFHELIHHVQMTYRFRQDSIALAQMVQELKGQEEYSECLADPSNIRDLLSYFYEAQAHWYTKTLFKDEAWFNYASERSVDNSLEFANDVLDLSMSDKEIVPGAWLKLGSHSTWGGNLSDYPMISTGTCRKNRDFTSGKSALYVHEPMLLPNEYMTSSYLQLDFHTHHHFMNRILESYQGENCLINNHRNAAVELLKKINTSFHENILNSTDEEFGVCEQSFKNAMTEGEAPRRNWLSSEFVSSQCDSLKTSDETEQMIRDIYFGNAPIASPFHHHHHHQHDIILDGGDGTGPTVEVLPGGDGTGPTAKILPDSVETGPTAEILPGGDGTGPTGKILPGGDGTGPTAEILPNLPVTPGK